MELCLPDGLRRVGAHRAPTGIVGGHEYMPTLHLLGKLQPAGRLSVRLRVISAWSLMESTVNRETGRA